MTSNAREAAPTRTARHEALEVFLGRWRAEGQSYGGSEQPQDDPKGAPAQWESTHTGRWHTGQFFLVQDERAVIGGTEPFDTLSIMGVDPETEQYFVRSFENHGFERRYDLTVDGRVWTLSGPSERASIEFSEDGRRQTLTWEWCPKRRWLPLCDRVAVRED